MIDIGTNLANKAFRADLDEVLVRARAAGVDAIVATGTSEAASRAVFEIAAARRGPDAPRVFSTAGIHPHHARDCSPGAVGALRELAAQPEVRAIGECGLDFDRNFSPKEAQLRAFEAQLELAAERQLPVFLHERAAHADFTRVMDRFRSRIPRGVVHCFTGTREELFRYLDLDLHVGITGWLCDERRGRHLVPLVKEIPHDRLMIETDAPYLLPRNLPRSTRPHGHRNEPSFLRYVLRAVADARGASEADVERASDDTASAFFALDGFSRP